MPLANLPAPPSLPQVPSQATGAYSAATVSSGPQPASVYQPQPTPIMLPPLHYQGPHAAQPFGYQPPPVGAPTNLIPQTGMVRTADQMDGETQGSDLPPAKRQKVAKLPSGQYYPEADWVNLHPVSTFGWPLFLFLFVFATAKLSRDYTASNITQRTATERRVQARMEVRWRCCARSGPTTNFVGFDTS